MVGPLLFGLLVALAILIWFVGLWRAARRRDPVEARLRAYGVTAGLTAGGEPAEGAAGPALSGGRRLKLGGALGERLALALARADLPLTANEFAMIVLGLAAAGYLVGRQALGGVQGLALAILGALLPIFYLCRAQARRRRAITNQLPDVLTMLVGALRGGYGLLQALEMLVKELPPPASKEFARVVRASSLGVPLPRALSEMAERVGSDDLALVVTAITVQYEMGGNLAQTLETIGETVRDRINMLREIRVLTAHQRFTATVLMILPVGLAVLMFLLNPDYTGRFLEPGLPRLMLIVAACMQVVGMLAIRRIINSIEV